MYIEISNINMSYNGKVLSSVKVNFTSHDEDNSIRISGYVPMTAEEYMGKNLTELENIIRDVVVEKITLAPDGDQTS